jgi:hypothetical protein
VKHRYNNHEFVPYLPVPRLLLLAVSQELEQPDHILVPHRHRQTDTARLSSRDTGDLLQVPPDVESAARILTEHFDPDDLYWAMVEEVRRRA